MCVRILLYVRPLAVSADSRAAVRDGRGRGRGRGRPWAPWVKDGRRSRSANGKISPKNKFIFFLTNVSGCGIMYVVDKQTPATEGEKK